MAHRDQRCRLQSSQSVAVRHDGRAPGLSSAQTMAPSIAQRYSALIAPDDGDRHQPEQQQHKELQETAASTFGLNKKCLYGRHLL